MKLKKLSISKAMNKINAYPQFYDLVAKRHSCRSFAGTPLSHEILLAILDAARLAPSGVNSQPWHFFVVRQQALREQLVSTSRECFKAAPAVIVACGDHDKSWHRARFDGKDILDIDMAIAIEHICLAATSLGVGSCWVCSFDPEMVKSALNLPDNMEPIALIPLGYPADDAVPEKKRKSIDEITTWVD
jgi:nitroreductase